MPRSSNVEETPAEVVGTPPIAIVFERIAGRPLAGDETRNERRDFCFAHEDRNNPSCDYNTEGNVWHCHSCNEHGGVMDFIVASGKVPNRRAAAVWLREQGLLPERGAIARWEIVDKIYSYVDQQGMLKYEVGRWQLGNGQKEFKQRRPKEDGNGYINNLKGVERIPYRLPELLADCARGATIFVVEGEKDVDRLRSLGLPATTNAQGAKWIWPTAWADYFAGASRIVVIGDNEERGIIAARFRASICALAVPDTRLIDHLPGVPEHGDISDFLDVGRTVGELHRLIDDAPIAQPYKVAYPQHAVSPLLADLTDTGNAGWFVSCVGEDVCYVPEYKTWYGWDGQRWVPDVMILKLIRVALDQMQLASADYNGSDRDAFLEWSEQSRSNAKRVAMLECAKGEKFASASEFDTYRHLLNVQNGILDCTRGELLPHDRSYLMTKITTVAYDKDALCPNWDAWLKSAMNDDEQCVKYLQKIMGGMLVGRPGTRRLFFAYGPPATGKSTITNVMNALLGDYACTIDFDIISQKNMRNSGQSSPELVRLKGMRLITAVESQDGNRLDVARLKQFVGGDLITARGLYQGMIQFPIEGTLFMSGNSRPIIDADESLWSKLKLIPFEQQIRNQNLNFFRECLEPELPGILAWAVRGAQELLAHDWLLDDPDIVKLATEEYREEENRLSSFIDKYCEVASTPDELNRYKIKPRELREAYGIWCQEENIRNPLGDRSFGNCIKRINGVSQTKSHGERMWKGIRLTQEMANRLLQPNPRGQSRNQPGSDEHLF